MTYLLVINFPNYTEKTYLFSCYNALGRAKSVAKVYENDNARWLNGKVFCEIYELKDKVYQTIYSESELDEFWTSDNFMQKKNHPKP